MNLLLSPRYTDDSRLLRLAALERGWSVHRVTNWRAPDIDLEHGVTMSGETSFVELMCEQLHLLMLAPPNDFLPTQPAEFLGREVELMSVADARKIKGRKFIKPANHKMFPAAVCESGDVIPEHVPDDSPVLVSDPVAFSVEFRGFIHDGKLATLSPYIRDGALAVDEDEEYVATEAEWEMARSFYERFLGHPDSVIPPRTVIDVGQLDDGRWVLVEANAAPESGICAADPDKVLDVIAGCFERA